LSVKAYRKAFYCVFIASAVLQKSVKLNLS
jgi:hypothetical protein